MDPCVILFLKTFDGFYVITPQDLAAIIVIFAAVCCKVTVCRKRARAADQYCDKVITLPGADIQAF